MLLSIIIPVFNAENFIEKCVNSIINQTKGLTYKLELIIINDGSTDKSPEILKKLQKENSIIKLFNQKNSGEGFARNVGLSKVIGDYFWFIDADDHIEGTILIEILNLLKTQKPESILIGYKSVDLEGNIISEIKYENNFFSRNDLIKQGIYANTVWSKVISTKIIKDNGLHFDTNVKTATDFDFSFKSLYFSKKIITLNDSSYNYVLNPDSISNIRSTEHLNRLAKDSVIVANNLNRFLKINEPQNSGSQEIFRPWLNNYLYGLLFSIFRFNYSFALIKEIIEMLKNNNNYPVDTTGMYLKKRIFMTIANHKSLFLLACKINRMISK
jgi:glycosyltransferase involved in cell wall biosynthesis